MDTEKDDREARARASVAALTAGRVAVLTDDVGAGHAVFAAYEATAGMVAFAVRHGSGLLSVAMSRRDADRLLIPPMAGTAGGPGFMVSVDARDGVSTGISARDRARTVRTLGDPTAEPADLIRPGHVLPIVCADGGVLQRHGVPEASRDLLRLAGIPAFAAVCALMANDGAPLAGAALAAFVAEQRLPTLSIGDVLAHRLAVEPHVRLVEGRSILCHGTTFTARVVLDELSGFSHVVLTTGDPPHADDVVMAVPGLGGL